MERAIPKKAYRCSIENCDRLLIPLQPCSRLFTKILRGFFLMQRNAFSQLSIIHLRLLALRNPSSIRQSKVRYPPISLVLTINFKKFSLLLPPSPQKPLIPLLTSSSTTSLTVGPTYRVPNGHIELSVYGWSLHVTSVTGRAIPWWSIYGCVANGIGAARTVDSRTHPTDPWVCDSRNVKVTATPMGGGNLDLSLLSDGFGLLSGMLDVYSMPNVGFRILDYNVPMIECEIVWGNTGDPAEGGGGGGGGVDVA